MAVKITAVYKNVEKLLATNIILSINQGSPPEKRLMISLASMGKPSAVNTQAFNLNAFASEKGLMGAVSVGKLLGSEPPLLYTRESTQGRGLISVGTVGSLLVSAPILLNTAEFTVEQDLTSARHVASPLGVDLILSGTAGLILEKSLMSAKNVENSLGKVSPSFSTREFTPCQGHMCVSSVRNHLAEKPLSLDTR